MTLRLRLAAIVSATVLATGAGMAFTGPASAAPSTTNYTYLFNNSAGYGELWFNPNAGPNGAFYSSHSNETPLTAINCGAGGDIFNGAYCELELPNRLCATWNAGLKIIDAITCQQLDSQEWGDADYNSTNGGYAISSLYEANTSDCYGWIRSPGSGTEVNLECSTVGNNDTWYINNTTS
jgi:hypothetical protein